MDDVVLHHRSASSSLSALLETTERLLQPFPCRPPPVFTPWFPPGPGRPLPIRPARPPPVIAAPGRSQQGATETLHKPKDDRKRRHGDAETLNTAPPIKTSRLSPNRPTDTSKGPVQRSWSVSVQKAAALRGLEPTSKQFDLMVSVHQLNLRQRARWSISHGNCGDASMEQVWRALTRLIRSCRLPTCNANIQRERREIWVFCDVLHSEAVGRFMKAELRLTGEIRLSVHRLGDVFSL